MKAPSALRQGSFHTREQHHMWKLRFKDQISVLTGTSQRGLHHPLGHVFSWSRPGTCRPDAGPTRAGPELPFCVTCPWEQQHPDRICPSPAELPLKCEGIQLPFPPVPSWELARSSTNHTYHLLPPKRQQRSPGSLHTATCCRDSSVT